MKFLIFILILVINCQQENGQIDWIMSEIEGNVLDIKWCNNTQNVLALTDQNHVYHSSNRGRTWVSLKRGIINYGQDQLYKKVGEIIKMISSPANNSYIFFQGTHEINWITTDCGESITAINTKRPIDEIQWHPLQKQWLLAASWSKCENYDVQDCEITKEVFVSFNLGQSWKLLLNFIYQFAWGKLIQNSQVPESRVIVAHQRFGKGKQERYGWNDNVHIYQSDDFFKTQQMLVSQGNTFFIQDNYFFVVKVMNKDEDDVELLVANSNNQYYSFNSIISPIKRLRQHGYTILDTSEGQVFLNINHDHQYGNLYVSDVNGLRFAPSLSFNVRSQEGFCDFQKLESIEGVYIANVYEHSKIQLLNEGNQFSKTKQQVNKANYVIENLHKYKQTRISLDKGGIWKPIQAPQLDKDGNKFACPENEECFLHLNHHSQDDFGPYYSNKNAVGLMIGTGNVGTHLSDRSDQQSTFLSRDGGKSWSHIEFGSHIYEIGDHGGILVMAQNLYSTNQIQYSLDEGLTFETIILNYPVQIQNILTEPSNTGIHFLVIAKKINDDSVFISLDFTSLKLPVCKGLEDPTSYQSDYERWSMQEFSDDPCILGKSISYIRKKQKSKCFNPEIEDKIYQIKNCTCTIYDWECDIGYSRQEDGQCTSKIPISFNEPINCQDSYQISLGYRKVPGSSCIYGVDKSPYLFKCGSWQLSRKIPYLMALLLIIFIIFSINQHNQFADNIQEIINKKFNDPRKQGYVSHKESKNIDSMAFEDQTENNQMLL